MKLMMIIAPLLYLSGNGYLFFKFWQAMNGMPLWCKAVAAVMFWLAAFSLFASIGLRESQTPEWLIALMFRIGAVWIVFLLYAVMTLAVFDVARLFFPSLKHPLWYALPITACVLLYGYVNNQHPKVEQLSITLQKSGASQPIRIVAISDVHLGHGTGIEALKGYVEKINAHNPDLIFIAGDLIDNSLKPLRGKPIREVLSSLKAPMGIYMVPGNHEYISGIDACADYLKQTPVILLRDSVLSLPCGIQLIGRDDRTNHRRKPLNHLLEQADRRKPIVVLDHQPFHLAQADSLGVDLQISGHTHHGQIWPLSLVTDAIYEQSHGYRKWKHAHIWVSSGLSLWGPPFRIGTNNDMAVIELQ